jgi:hypothetical protein
MCNSILLVDIYMNISVEIVIFYAFMRSKWSLMTLYVLRTKPAHRAPSSNFPVSGLCAGPKNFQYAKVDLAFGLSCPQLEHPAGRHDQDGDSSRVLPLCAGITSITDSSTGISSMLSKKRIHGSLSGYASVVIGQLLRRGSRFEFGRPRGRQRCEKVL